MPLTTWLTKAGPLSDLMLLGTPNQGIISLASTLDTSVAFSMHVGYSSTQPVRLQTTIRRYQCFTRLDLSEVHLQVLEWVDPILLREQQGLWSLSWVMLGAAQASLAGRLS
jgi:hypothetical protein